VAKVMALITRATSVAPNPTAIPTAPVAHRQCRQDGQR
jgi:hypothetical protein